MTVGEDVKIRRPIFIVGNIRSGTTILYQLLSTHPEVCWFSNHTNRFPNVPAFAAMERMREWPLVGARIRRAIIDRRSRLPCVARPDEGDRIYHEHSGFGTSPDGLETELSDDMERRLKTAIRAHLRYTGKPRFLSKQTANNRRLELIERMFPDALYVHVIRDGRAVANSTLRVPWWSDTHVWWLGHAASQWPGEPIELAALYWMKTVEEIRRHAPALGDRYMEVRYEALVRDVHAVMDDITHFCCLGANGGFMTLLPQTLPDMNEKWKMDLDERQKQALQSSAGDFLASLGYE